MMTKEYRYLIDNAGEARNAYPGYYVIIDSHSGGGITAMCPIDEKNTERSANNAEMVRRALDNEGERVAEAARQSAKEFLAGIHGARSSATTETTPDSGVAEIFQRAYQPDIYAAAAAEIYKLSGSDSALEARAKIKSAAHLFSIYDEALKEANMRPAIVIQLLLHYHRRVGRFEPISPASMEWERTLVADDILLETKVDLGDARPFTLTQKGEAWLSMILATPYPVPDHNYKDPRTGEVVRRL